MQVTENNTKRKTTVFVEEALHREVRIKAAPLDMSFQQVAEEALRFWLSRSEATAVHQETADEDRVLGEKFVRWARNPQNETHRLLAALILKEVEKMK